MTATEPSVREAAARAWSLIADHRAGRGPDEPGLPLGIALDHVTDSGCERDTAFFALRTAAAAALARSGANLPGRIVGNPDTWAACARNVLHYLGSVSFGLVALGDFERADAYRDRVIDEQVRRTGLCDREWRERADWLAWADDARLAILWLRQLSAECAA